MLIAELHFNAVALEKLGRRGITEDEAEQLLRNGPFTTRNPHPRVPGSRLLIGPTDGGRLLTLVIQRDPVDATIWHVQTGWDANLRERRGYQRGR